jgi:hypothetical protein
MLRVSPPGFLLGDVLVGDLAEGRDIGLGCGGGFGCAPVGERINSLEDQRPEFSVLDARLIERRLRVGAERVSRSLPPLR